MDIEKKVKKTERIVTKCEKCNKPFSYIPGQRVIGNDDKFDPEHPVCSTCRAKAVDAEYKQLKAESDAHDNQVAFTRKCKELDCGKEFVITCGEEEYYYAHNLALPERCPSCRAKRKEMRLKNAANNDKK